MAATVMDVLGERKVQRQQRSILNRAYDDTARTQQQGSQMLVDESGGYGPGRAAAFQGQEDANYNQSLKDIGAGSGVIDTAGDAGNVSADFARAKADKALTEGTRLTQIAREMAKVRAPGQQLQTESMHRADTQGRVASMFGANSRMANAANLDAQNVEEPWWGKLGKLGQAAGRAYFTSGMGG